MDSQPSNLSDEMIVSDLFRQLLNAWNRRSANDFANLFDQDSSVIGFDGSQMNGRDEIAAEIGRIFKDHETAAYIGKIRAVRFLSLEVAILRAVVGMVPPGQADLNPAVNTIQTLVAVKQAVGWRIAHFQNTPAQFHGRPDLAAALTEELRQLL